MEGWYLDTGATNHMTGRSDVFSHLDRAMRGSVKFSDGSVVAIHGCGTVIFSRRDGEHKALDGVYYIPKLRNSIISVGQLMRLGPRFTSKMVSCGSMIVRAGCWQGFPQQE
jgi:hypothetical protein